MRHSVIFLFLYLSLSPFKYLPHLVEEGQASQFLPAYPCASLALDSQGLTCQIGESYWDTTIFLSFPRLYFSEENVDELRALPVSSASQRVHALTVHNEKQIVPLELQQVQITLSFVPAISNTLIPYLEDQWLSFGKDRVPYVGQWEVSYLLLVGDVWLPQYFSGKIMPDDIPDLSADLAADINYNGVPTAFWNYQVVSP
ncbi:MAG: hypothetical protein HN855_08105 [Anaerolineae bacterium]|jgi:hypothetical protein|nr:hypothetical protein [Anaerolineae bacterium]MBT7325105.1 hypothetical protein [Anaerolineae bacterium]